MQLKNNPQRTCIACRSTKDKGLLIRIVKDKNNNFSVDKLGKLNGRGAYIKCSVEAINIARTKKVLDRALETTVPEEVYEKMLKEANDRQN